MQGEQIKVTFNSAHACEVIIVDEELVHYLAILAHHNLAAL